MHCYHADCTLPDPDATGFYGDEAIDKAKETIEDAAKKYFLDELKEANYELWRYSLLPDDSN